MFKDFNTPKKKSSVPHGLIQLSPTSTVRSSLVMNEPFNMGRPSNNYISTTTSNSSIVLSALGKEVTAKENNSAYRFNHRKAETEMRLYEKETETNQ